MKKAKWLIAAAAVTVYVACPAYRYWVIGSWVAVKVLRDKPLKPRVIPKGSRQYNRLVGG
jgi:hypothetical protein